MGCSVAVEIINKKGLHARAAAKFVKTVTGYKAQVYVVKKATAGGVDSPVVVGSSILGLMMLGADKGSILQLSADGEQAQEVLDALQRLLQDRFGEEE